MGANTPRGLAQILYEAAPDAACCRRPPTYNEVMGAMAIRPELLYTLAAVTSAGIVATIVRDPSLAWVGIVWAGAIGGEVLRRRRRARPL